MKETRKQYEDEVARAGEYQGSPRYTPYFHRIIFMSDASTIINGHKAIRIIPEDVDLFPELKNKQYAYTEYTKDGYITCKVK